MRIIKFLSGKLNYKEQQARHGITASQLKEVKREKIVTGFLVNEIIKERIETKELIMNEAKTIWTKLAAKGQTEGLTGADAELLLATLKQVIRSSDTIKQEKETYRKLTDKLEKEIVVLKADLKYYMR